MLRRSFCFGVCRAFWSCPRWDHVPIVDPCYRQHRVHLRWPLTLLNAVLLARRVTIDVQVSVLVDQEQSMCLRHKKKKLMILAEIVLWETDPGAVVLVTARHHSAASRTSLLASAAVLLWLLEFQKMLATFRPQQALLVLVSVGLCGRGRPGRFSCGAQGLKSTDCKASGTRRAGFRFCFFVLHMI